MPKANMDCFGCAFYDFCVNPTPFCDYIDQNKVIILAFDVHDIVYVCTCSWRPPANENEITAWMVVSYMVSCNAKHEKKLKYRICELKNGKPSSNQFDFGPEDIGTKVFYEKADAVEYFFGGTDG